jgi:hypothetical protein
MTPNTQPSTNATTTPIPESGRMEFLPKLFGPSLMIIGENSVYTFMDNLCSDYHGGFWRFYETEDGVLYMAPDGPARMKLAWDGNGFEGEVSSDAAGIIATLFALSHMSMAFRGAEHLAEHYHRLLDFAAEHEDSRTIFAAID